MRIDIYDYANGRRTIDTKDMELAGRWAAGWFRELMTDTAAAGPCRLEIWPSDPEESTLIGQRQIRLDQDGLLEFAGVLLNASAELAALEVARKRAA